MADDRTPRTISLTESAPDDDQPRKRGKKDERRRRQIRLDHDAVVGGERKSAEQGAEERPGSKLA